MPMLWRGSGAAAHVSILGSIHLWDGELPAWVLRALEESDRVVFEADTSQQVLFPELPNNLTISAAWPSLADALEQAAEVTGADFNAINRLWPAGAAAVLSLRAQLPHMQPELGVEAVLRTRSAELSIQPVYLESHAEIFHLTMVVPDAREQAAFLAHTLQGLPSLPARVRRAAKEWREGDLVAVVEALEHPQLAVAFPDVTAGMFQNRHELWRPRLVQYVEEAAGAGDTLLVVVGCGHLARAGNLFAYLEPHGLVFEQGT
ncbi:MAG TPA: TraB/GumN family protein [Thermoanaerobaculia bacterium]|nr:TraB/GumN family protein [Thermoanaerobaculia bacterium]